MKTTYTNWSGKVFPGFYDSILYSGDDLYYFNEGETPDGYGWDFRDGGFAKYADSVCKDWTFWMDTALDGNKIGLSVKFKSMWSPSEYNFYTDKLNLSVKFNLNSLKRYCFHEKKAAFDAYLHDHWSSYDGFISFIPNSAWKFTDAYRNGCSWATKDELIQVMLEFFILQNIDFEWVEEQVLENKWTYLDENVVLERESDWTHWDFEYSDSGYVPTKRIA